MKTGIHPTYYDHAQVACTCGNKFTTGSTLAKIDIEVCSQCHPFFTGQQKFVDTRGRIDKFARKVEQGKGYKTAKAAKAAKKAKKVHAKKTTLA